MQLVHLEVDLEELVDHVEHTPALCHVLGGLAIDSAGPEAGHEVFCCLLEGGARLPALGLELFVRARRQPPEVEANHIHHGEWPVVFFVG